MYIHVHVSCMCIYNCCKLTGRLGNQLEQFLGSLAFARNIQRTLVLTPLRDTQVYANV